MCGAPISLRDENCCYGVRASSIDGPPSLRLSADTHVLDDTPTMIAAGDYGPHGADPPMMMIVIASLHRLGCCRGADRWRHHRIGRNQELSARKHSSGRKSIGDFLHSFSLSYAPSALLGRSNECGVNDNIDRRRRDLSPQM